MDERVVPVDELLHVDEAVCQDALDEEERLSRLPFFSVWSIRGGSASSGVLIEEWALLRLSRVVVDEELRVEEVSQGALDEGRPPRFE